MRNNMRNANDCLSKIKVNSKYQYELRSILAAQTASSWAEMIPMFSCCNSLIEMTIQVTYRKPWVEVNIQPVSGTNMTGNAQKTTTFE